MTTATLRVTYDLSEATERRHECRELGEHAFRPGAENTPGHHKCARCGALMTVREALK